MGTMTDLPPTRAAGEDLLAAFAPRMGRRYANGRNTDHGPGGHKAVSSLSPYIRRRLVLEQDAVAAALAAHGSGEAEKFVQEVIWRGYFKVWLERRPQVWISYRKGLEADFADIDRDRRLRRDLNRAMDGQTGLDYFDVWARELQDTGYLHNHARMWFASIWIFTLGLPWRIGADFFYRHLLDGDGASNTLGWRWVAGHLSIQITRSRCTPWSGSLKVELFSVLEQTTTFTFGTPQLQKRFSCLRDIITLL